MSRSTNHRLLRVRLDADLHADLLAESTATGASPSDIVRRALVEHLRFAVTNTEQPADADQPGATP